MLSWAIRGVSAARLRIGMICSPPSQTSRDRTAEYAGLLRATAPTRTANRASIKWISLRRPIPGPGVVTVCQQLATQGRSETQCGQSCCARLKDASKELLRCMREARDRVGAWKMGRNSQSVNTSLCRKTQAALALFVATATEPRCP